MENVSAPDLPPEVAHLRGPEIVERLGLQVVQVVYRMEGLNVTIGWTVSPPTYFMAPDRLHIDAVDTIIDFLEGDESEMSAEAAAMYNGITKPFLRAIPMAHARHLLREPYEQLSVRLVRDSLMPLPTRVETDEEYVHVAALYVDLVHGPSAEPIRRLVEWTGVKAATWSARLQRARAKGILVGRGRQAEISPQYRAVEREIRDRHIVRAQARVRSRGEHPNASTGGGGKVTAWR